MRIVQGKSVKIILIFIFIFILLVVWGMNISRDTIQVLNSYRSRISGAEMVSHESDRVTKSVILMIGDGMGAEHRLAAQLVSVGRVGVLEMDGLGVSGELRTGSADKAITDSAASGTAMATGFKTNNGVVGLDQNSKYLVTILEQAQEMGKSVGLVTTSHITHATPASFGAHVENRNQMSVIAEQLLSIGVNVLFGGGEDEFLPETEIGCYPEPGERVDGRNLIKEAIAEGYTYVCDSEALASIEPTATTHLLGLFADEGMNEPYSPSLAVMTELAISLLSNNPEGFFLLVEGGQIDWGAHNNDAERVISNTIAFDQAVNVAKIFTDTSSETLLLVTADHETGGLAVSFTQTGHPDEDGPFSILDGGTFFVTWTTTGHTAVDVPITARGPFSDRVRGIHENTFIHDLLIEAFCYQDPGSPGVTSSPDPCSSLEHD